MKAKKQLIFAVSWTGIYTVVFNLAKVTFSEAIAMDMILSAGWVFLLFLVATYSRIFFFTVIPIVFVTSGMVAYAEWLINAPISRDVVASAFQTNWQELRGITGSAFGGWILGGLFLCVLCSWHFFHLDLKQQRSIRFIVTMGFIVVYLWCADKTRPFYGHESNVFHWRHPYDYLEYTTNYIKESIAISRHGKKYDLSSAPADRGKPPGDLPLQVVVVIGESARADHFGVYGYARNTTPLLQKENNLLVFKDVESCGTTTVIAVPCLMTRATRDHIKSAKEETSFVSLFKKLGFRTLWISEQAKFDRENTIVSSIADDAETAVFQDNNLTLKLYEFKEYYLEQIRSSGEEKLSVYHMMGSHFPYQWMYPVEFGYFKPTCPDTSLQNCPHDSLVNTYDNTIVFTDHFLSNIIGTLKNTNAIMVYVSDHGEYLGEQGRFLHGQDTDDAEVRKVPMIWWVSDLFIKLYPDKVRHMRAKLHDRLSHDHIFHSVLNCAGIESSVVDKTLSICD